MDIIYATRATIPYPSAASINSMRMCESLSGLGHNVTLAVGRKFWRKKTVRNPWAYYGVKPSFRVKRIWEFPRTAVWFDKAVVMMTKRANGLLYARYPRILPTAAAAQVQVVLEVHSQLTVRQLQQLSRIADAPGFLGVVVITGQLRSAINAVLPEMAERICVAPDAVNVSCFSPTPCRQHALKVGYVGSLHPGKGMEIIPHIARLLPQTPFLVVGGPPQQVRRWRSLKTSVPNVSLLGPTSPARIPQRMDDFDIALLPNQPRVVLPCGDDIGRFTSPMKLFEYMAAGKAIVASDLPNLREVLRHESNCLLVRHDDPQAWADAIERLEKDEALRRRISKQARAEAVETYSYETRFHNILNFFGLEHGQRAAA